MIWWIDFSSEGVDFTEQITLKPYIVLCGIKVCPYTNSLRVTPFLDILQLL